MSANWRGYVATWEIRDGSLFLTGVQADVETGVSGPRGPLTRSAGMEEIVPESLGRPLAASWYSGLLRIPFGNWVRRPASWITYQHYMIVRVSSGKVLSTHVEENPEYAVELAKPEELAAPNLEALVARRSGCLGLMLVGASLFVWISS